MYFWREELTITYLLKVIPGHFQSWHVLGNYISHNLIGRPNKWLFFLKGEVFQEWVVYVQGGLGPVYWHLMISLCHPSLAGIKALRDL